MKKLSAVLILIPMIGLFSGCTKIGEKSASITFVYGIMTALSLLMLLGYFCLVHKKETWFVVLLSSVAIVNAGYYSIAAASTLEEALLANRIAYLGSVFLPLSMFMIVLDVIKAKYKKWFPGLLAVVAMVVFFIAASPGYSDIYYKEVYLENISGVSVLEKVYGPLHSIYLFYLLFYFAAMVSTVIHTAIKKKLDSTARTAVLIGAVFVNIGVWFIEQIVKLDFEILSVSYIISELFLLGLYLMIQEEEKLISDNRKVEEVSPKPKLSKAQEEMCEFFSEGVLELTPAEKAIYGFYLEGKTTKEIREKLNITENTLKYHNKNIYSKLGVSSRKELIEIAKLVKKRLPK